MTIKHVTKHEKKERWLGQNEAMLEAKYPGMWVAVSDDGLAGVGEYSYRSYFRGRGKGFVDMLVAGVKDREYQGVYLLR